VVHPDFCLSNLGRPMGRGERDGAQLKRAADGAGREGRRRQKEGWPMGRGERGGGERQEGRPMGRGERGGAQ
jgi:hypothetical protein